jgi:F-type H+-transporting ATPase subunit b
MQIDWWTLGLQAINFLVLVWLLSRFLYRPVRKVIADRRAEAEHALADAKAKQAEAEAARTRYETDRATLAQARRDLEARVHKEAQIESGQIVEIARKQAAEIVETARKAAKEEQSRALEATKQDIAAMAVMLATDLLGQQGDRGSGAAAIAAVGRFVAELPAERRDELRREADAADEPVELRTAAELSEADRSAWTAAMHGWFGDKVQASFATDPAILGGAMLRLPHAELDVTWARQLREAEAHILGGRDGPRE